MSRRGTSKDLDFGSDSFLDIIANIVGILIILIVVAGVKVSRQPVPVADVPTVEVPAVEAQLVDAPAPDTPSKVVAKQPTVDQSDLPAAPPETGPTLIAAPEPAAPPILPTLVQPEPDDLDENQFQPWVEVEDEPIATVVPPPKIEPPPLSPELLKQRRALAESLNNAESRLLAARKESSDLRNIVDGRSQKIAAETTAIANLQSEVENIEAAAQTTKTSVDRNLLKLATLKGQLKTATKPRTKVETIKHRLNPVSHEVSKKEIHFRLSKGRLSIVPLEELMDNLKRHVRKRSDSLMRFNRHTGRIGPISGYKLNYVMERQSLSTLQKLRDGSGFVRVEITEATIEPTTGVREMTPAEALRPGSEFSSQLHRVSADASLTFWVYPDSFEAYREIQSVVHDLGFAVAARPLPFGIPIGVSPNGTRSNAQ